MPAAARTVLDLFSSVRLGIALLALLFVYMTVGSAGILYPVHPNLFHPDAWVHAQVRQWRPFEMTEFEWFNWWPFNVLLGLLAVNMVVTTVRRIPLRPVNYGVWMIHAGVMVLMVGSGTYFSSKVEGEVPVVRRAIAVSVAADAPGGTAAAGSLLAVPGARLALGEGAGRYELEVQSIDPSWELRSGADQGKRAYSVNVLVTAPGARFVRQLIAGYPGYTEDMVFTEDRAQPMKRAVKVTGKATVDERLALALEYAPADAFYLKNDLEKSWALYVRRPGERRWVERPVVGLPLYNDSVPVLDEVFVGAGDTVRADALRVRIPAASADDPAPTVEFEATGYLRYAQMRARWVPGGPDAAPNAVATVDVSDGDGRSQQYRLVASDPRRRSADGGVLALRQVSDEEQVAGFMQPPSLVFRVPGKGIDLVVPVKDAALGGQGDQPWKPLGAADSGYAYRFVGAQDDLPVGGRNLSVAIVDLRTPAGELRRWAFSDATMSRDLRPDEPPMAAMKRGGESFLDRSIEVEYRPGNGLALALLVAGPEPGRLRLVDSLGRAEARVVDVRPREPVALAAGVTLSVTEWMPAAVQESKPFVVPPEQRQRDARELFAMMRLSAAGDAARGQWLGYHPYVFDRQEDVLHRYWYSPSTVTLPDGSRLEVMFSRRRLPLPAQVALEEFRLDTHIGGFSGQTSSIRNYTSLVRFRDAGKEWGAPEAVSVNVPVEHDGFWFFQSQWDPPEQERDGVAASAGLNYTVLGVGNREGVGTQLAGCILAAAGMAYAFYVKPVIKRRHRRLVLEEIERARAEGRRPVFPKGLSENVHA